MEHLLTNAELRALALEPQKAKNEHGEIENRRLDELVALTKIPTEEKAASARSAWAGLRMGRVILPGAQ